MKHRYRFVPVVAVVGILIVSQVRGNPSLLKVPESPTVVQRAKREELSDFLDLGLTTEPAHDPVRGDYDIRGPANSYTGPQKDEESCITTSSKYGNKHPDEDLDCGAIAVKYGYAYERVDVTTEDGYIISMQRIHKRRKRNQKHSEIPVLLQHGIMGNCMSWLLLPGNKNLAFKLADADYDVYLGNIRGTSYSKGHKNISMTFNTSEYWNFGLYEIGYYDIPAMIDEILNITGQPDLYYIGHSLGTSYYLIATSTRPEYSDKIRVGFMLAPAGDVSDMTNPSVVAMLKLGTTDLAVWKIQYGNYINDGSFTKAYEIQKDWCSPILKACGLCTSAVFNTFGYNPKQTSGFVAHLFSLKYFDKTSSKSLAHIAQVVKTAKLQLYDYREAENLRRYGTKKPPLFPLHKITSPTVAFWGVSDNLTPPRGVKRTLQMLPPGVLVENNRVFDKQFNHIDFLLAKDANYLVYDRIVFLMKKGRYVKQRSTTIGTRNPQMVSAKLADNDFKDDFRDVGGNNREHGTEPLNPVEQPNPDN